MPQSVQIVCLATMAICFFIEMAVLVSLLVFSIYSWFVNRNKKIPYYQKTMLVYIWKQVEPEKVEEDEDSNKFTDKPKKSKK